MDYRAGYSFQRWSVKKAGVFFGVFMEGFDMEPIGMGAVLVQIKLTNAIDEALVSRGLLAPNRLRECETQALVDTGALTLVLPLEIVEQLGLRIRVQQITPD